MSETRVLSPAAAGGEWHWSAHPPAAGAAAGSLSGARSQPPGSRPTWVEVDLDAIRHNVAALRAHAAAPALMAVVKADGYGHGIEQAARAALEGGATALAVALVEEGETLRAASIDAPILVMVEPPPEAIGALLTARLTPAVYSPGFAEALDAAARARGEPAAVHLKLDTGMRRVGVPQPDWEDALRRVRDAPGLHLEALWTHYAVADDPGHPSVEHQSREFSRALMLAERLGAPPETRHIANSAATLHLHDQHYDMVRPGLSIYGLEPAPGLARATPLRPALAFYSRLALVKRLRAGEAVSYGQVWAPERDTTVGTVPAGYADGVVRALSGSAEAVTGGRRVAYAGRVCMDQFVVDLGGEPARAGDEICLIGRQGQAEVSADDWARWLGTINYEVVTRIGGRVPRVYVDGEASPAGGDGPETADGTG